MCVCVGACVGLGCLSVFSIGANVVDTHIHIHPRTNSPIPPPPAPTRLPSIPGHTPQYQYEVQKNPVAASGNNMLLITAPPLLPTPTSTPLEAKKTSKLKPSTLNPEPYILNPTP